MNSDEHWMQTALELAERGRGWVEPNPMVGCVVVRDGNAIGQGYHERFGGPHAEVHALQNLTVEQTTGSTIYVTLEPCSHFGKTPPCVDLVLKHQPRRVVLAMQDPFEQVAGRGIERMRRSGIEVDVGVLEERAKKLNAPYLKRLETGLPWVIAKWAMTLDGAIASSTGDSRWISNEASREQVHQLRARVDAILVGSGTVLADDPLLTARLPSGIDSPRTALRVVLDRRFRTPLQSRLVRTAREFPLLIAVDEEVLTQARERESLFREQGVEFLALANLPSPESRDPKGRGAESLRFLLRKLAERGGTNVLVEGGSELFGSLFDAGMVDQVECYIAPKILGDASAKCPIAGLGVAKISESISFSDSRWETLGDNVHFSGFTFRE